MTLIGASWNQSAIRGEKRASAPEIDPIAAHWPAWLLALRRQYPGVLEQRAMEYTAKPDRVASGRERLGE